jgi:AGZA family xanthine/uracil permease-like MFS transporter
VNAEAPRELPISRFFEVRQRSSTLAAEVRGGVATFLTMSYILVANPAILAAAGVPIEGAVAATALAASVCSILMGVGANFPIALAPGMGLNAVVAFQIAQAAGSWQRAMGLVVLDGLLVLLLVLLGLREAVMNAIPIDMRRAIGVGIGFFIAFIGAVNARLVVVPPGTVMTLANNPAAVLPPVTYGTLGSPGPLVAVGGMLVIVYLVHRRIPGAIVLGIALNTVAAVALGLTALPATGWVGLPRADTLLQADVAGAMSLSLAPLLLAMVMVDFFDTIGTVTAIAEKAGLSDGSGRIPRLGRVLAIDAASASIGGLAGASSATSYVESAAGVAEGARTGLHSVVVGVLFLLAAFAAPLVAVVPNVATAPALIVVGFLMAQQITAIDFTALETAIPAFLIFLMVPLTYSIAHGIGYGCIAYVAIKVLGRRWSDVHPLMYGTSGAFAAYFVWG